MNKAEKISKLNKINAKLVDKQEGRWVLVHDQTNVIGYEYSCNVTTKEEYTVDHFDTKQEVLDEIEKLGLILTE